MNGTLIAFEGVDGSGKSTLMRQVAAQLRDSGHEIVTTFEPGDTPLGAILRREALEATSDPETELLLFAADRADHVRKVLRPALRRGAIVLCDRFEGSSIAYQGAWRGLGEQLVSDISRVATSGLSAHLNIWVDVPEQVSRSRRSEPINGMDSASAGAYSLLHDSFTRQSDGNDRWLRLDGTENLEQLAETASAHILTLHQMRANSGRLLLLCGPSGSGKNTLVTYLQQRGDVDYVLSATTRPPRLNEVDGGDYRFVDDDTFDRLVGLGSLAEWSTYAGHRYGTLVDSLIPHPGRHRIAVVELSGARAIREAEPDAIVVFLTVDEPTLIERLGLRNSETDGELRERIAVARNELRTGPAYADIEIDGRDLDTMLNTINTLLGPPNHSWPAP